MDIKIKSDNQNIAATLIKPKDNFKKPLPALIFVHGWKSDKRGNSKRAKEISKLGFICLCIDLRGHGESDGTIDQFSVDNHLEDVKAAYKYLTSLPEVNKNKIGIIGSSYGGNLAAIAANYLDFEWLVLRVPALYVDKYSHIPSDQLIGKNEEKHAFRTTNGTPKESSALKGVANFNGNILIIESDKDTVIPHPVIENYLRFIPNKSKLTYTIMKDAPHSLETEAQEKAYIDILKNWLEETA